VPAAQPARQVIAADVRHLQVEDQGVGPEVALGSHDVGTAMNAAHVVALGLQQGPQRRHRVAVVIGNENLQLPRRRKRILRRNGKYPEHALPSDRALPRHDGAPRSPPQ